MTTKLANEKDEDVDTGAAVAVDEDGSDADNVAHDDYESAVTQVVAVVLVLGAAQHTISRALHVRMRHQQLDVIPPRHSRFSPPSLRNNANTCIYLDLVTKNIMSSKKTFRI